MKYPIIIILFLLASCSLSKNSTLKSGSGWQVLFNGSSTDKLRGYQMDGFSSAWKVEDGLLKTVTGVSNVDLITKEQYKDFELEFEWNALTGGNSGVFFHVQELAKQEAGNGNSANWLLNYEMQLLDDVNFDDKEPKRSAGALYDLITPINKSLNPVGQFNSSRLVVKGTKGEHWLNGKKVVEYEMDGPALTALIRNSKFKSIPGFAKSKQGHIQFQHHGQEVWFKNIRIRRL